MRDIAKKTTEMAQLKEEQEKVEIKHEKAFQKAIVSDVTLCGIWKRILYGACNSLQYYVANPQDTLTDYHRAAFIIKVDPPLIDTQGRSCRTHIG